MGLPWCFHGTFMQVSWLCNTSIVLPWDLCFLPWTSTGLHGISMRFSRGLHWIPMELAWDFYGTSEFLLWDYSGISMRRPRDFHRRSVNAPQKYP